MDQTCVENPRYPRKNEYCFYGTQQVLFQVLLDLARNGDVKVFAKDDFKRVVLNDELEKCSTK